MADVRLKHIDKSFGDKQVLHDINLDIQDGDFLVLEDPHMSVYDNMSFGLKLK